jgi:hypothetical protein
MGGGYLIVIDSIHVVCRSCHYFLFVEWIALICCIVVVAAGVISDKTVSLTSYTAAVHNQECTTTTTNACTHIISSSCCCFIFLVDMNRYKLAACVRCGSTKRWSTNIIWQPLQAKAYKKCTANNCHTAVVQLLFLFHIIVWFTGIDKTSMCVSGVDPSAVQYTSIVFQVRSLQ